VHDRRHDGAQLRGEDAQRPEQVLAYLFRYTRVAISNSRLIAADATGVTFSYKDYRIEGPGRYATRESYRHRHALR
jgi:Putative transposase